MTWQGREAEEWMQALDEDGDARSSGSSIPELSRDEEAKIARLAQLIEAEQPGQKSWRGAAVGGGLVVAAAAAALFALSSPGDEGDASKEAPSAVARAQTSSGAAALERGGERTQVTAQTALVSGDRILSAGPLALHFVEGAKANLSEGATAEIIKTASAEGLRLQEGRVDLKIPKQVPGKTWNVVTTTATVTVIGTQFAVWLADDGGAQVTCVAVTEGRVRAESSAHSAELTTGQKWSSAPHSTACHGTQEDALVHEAQSKEVQPTRAISPNSPVKTAPPPSSLAAQNQLFLQIVKARREGRLAEAQQLGKTFLTRFPGSPHETQVRAELAKAR